MTTLDVVETGVAGKLVIPELRIAALDDKLNGLIRAEIGRMVVAGEMPDDFVASFHDLAACDYPMAGMVFGPNAPVEGYTRLGEGVYFHATYAPLRIDPIMVSIVLH